MLLRNIIENPAWYTAYTPYQPEISQGRLEALLNFQTMVADLSGMELANSSMLDEATAAAEAMTLLRRANRSKSPRFVVDADLYPQTLAVIETRAEPLGIEIVSADLTAGLPEGDFFGVIAQIPGASGRVVDYTSIIAEAHERGALVAVGADLLAMTLITSPGELGADACFGTTQRFGVPMGYGGPHAGYLAVHSKHARQLPAAWSASPSTPDGDKAYRLALQTREQHIRREKATSNICTAQVLLAILAAMYASYHGAEGLKAIALRVAARAHALANGLREGGVTVVHDSFFDTVLAQVPGKAADVVAAAKESGINLRLVDADHVGISCDEATTADHVLAVLDAFGIEDAVVAIEAEGNSVPGCSAAHLRLPAARSLHPLPYGTAMLRYLRALSDKDIALDRSMIPLGSCTMKLNATAEMESITWPAFKRDPPVRAHVGCARSAEDHQGSRRTGWSRSPATTTSACNPTPAARGNTRACSRSATTTSAGATTTATPVSFRRVLTAPTRLLPSWPGCASRLSPAVPTVTSTSTICARRSPITPSVSPRS